MGARGVVVAGLALLLLALEQPQPPGSPVLAGALAVLALLLEAAAPHVQKVGFISASGGLYLALALSPEGAPALASLTALLALVLRTLARGSCDPATRWAELLPDLMGVAVALTLLRSLAGTDLAQEARLALALLGYLGGQTLALSAGSRVTSRVMEVRGVSLLITCAIAASALQGGLAVPPLLALCYLLAPRLGQAHHVTELVEREKRLAQRDVESISERMDLLRQQHHQRTLERELFSSFAHAFAREPSLQSTHELVVSQVVRAVTPDTAYLFIPREGRLHPVAGHDREALKRLQENASSGQSEPVVRECFKRGHHLRKKAKPRAGVTLLPPGENALALPLGGRGVLYLGWNRPPSLSSEVLEALLTLSELAGIAMGTAQELAEVERELLSEATGHQEARAWVERFDILLAAVRSLAGHLSTQEVLETLRQLAGHLVRHDGGLIVVRLGEGERVLAWPDPPPEGSLTAYLEAVLEEGRPLEGRPPGAPVLWPVTLTAPIAADESALGAIILGRREGQFTAQEQESLSLGAVQMAMMLEKARLYEEVLDSRRRLQESQAQLVSSSKLAAVGQLAAGVAHELNTPLGALLLRLEAAQRSLDKGNSEGVRKNLKVADTALMSAKEIVAKLLAYSHDKPSKPVPVLVSSVVDQAVLLVGGQLETQQVSLSLGLVPECRVLGNPNELSQVLINLLLNARDAILSAAPRGEVSVRVRRLEREVQLEVEDSGPGLPESIRERVFEPFFTTKPVGVGTGLGLSVSRQIVAAHQGELRLLEGSPTRFRVSLPLLEETRDSTDS